MAANFKEGGSMTPAGVGWPALEMGGLTKASADCVSRAGSVHGDRVGNISQRRVKGPRR